MYAYINSMCNRTSILSGDASLRAVWGVYSWPDGSLCPGLRSIGASVLVGLLPGSSWWVVKSLGRKVRCPFFVGSLGSWSCFLSFKVLFLLKLVMYTDKYHGKARKNVEIFHEEKLPSHFFVPETNPANVPKNSSIPSQGSFHRNATSLVWVKKKSGCFGNDAFLFGMLNWVVVSNIFYFHPYLGMISNLTNIFSNGLKPPTSKISGAIPLKASNFVLDDLDNLKCFPVSPPNKMQKYPMYEIFYRYWSHKFKP